MPSSLPETIVIACPHCGTRYQVPPDAIGSARKVSCAHCGRTWTAHRPAPPTPEELADRVFGTEEEALLDDAFIAAARPGPAPGSAAVSPAANGEIPAEVMRTIAQIKAAIAPKVKHAEAKGSEDKPAAPEADGGEDTERDRALVQGRFQRRQRILARSLPTSRLRSLTRLTSLGLLVAALGGAYLFRVPIVTALPDLAGAYAALGVRVNVVGLDFSGLTTTRSRRGDAEVLTVEASIRSIESRPVAVPEVVVDLFDASGRSLYQWSVAPRVAELEPGESIGFTAELTRPPEGATRATVSFAGFAPSPTAIPSPSEAPQADPAHTTPHPEASEHHG